MIINTLVAYADNLGGALGSNSCPGTGQIKNITDFINFFTCTLMKAVVPLLVSLAVTGFVYGIIKFFLNPENEEKRKEGKTFMLWGLIALFVIVSMWGIVKIFSSSFGTPSGLPTLPV